MVVGKLYMGELSPPARAVLLVEKALGVEFEHIIVNTRAQENRKPEYEKMNPQHTIPLYVDQDGTIVWDSHAILAYLVGKYAKTDSLYPKDLAKRAVVDQRLHFDSGNLFANLKAIIAPMFFQNKKGVSDLHRATMHDQYNFLNKFLDGKEWIAGDEITIADLSIVSTVSSLAYIVPIPAKFANLIVWLKRCEQLPYYEANAKGLKGFAELIKPCLGQ